MDIYVLDGDFNKIGFPIDNYISCIWRTSFYEIGDFELYLAYDKETLSLLRTGAYLVRDQDMNVDDGMYYQNVMEIKSIKVDTNEENGDYITVTGKDLKALLNQRVILNDKIFSSTLNEHITLMNILPEVFEANFSNPVNPYRKIENVRLFFNEYDHHEHIIVEGDIHDNAGDWMIEQCKTYECGIIPYVNTQKSSCPGTVDYIVKRIRNNKNIVFSDEYIDISASLYTRSGENRKNVAIVAGDEVEGVKIVQTVNDEKYSGWNRYETYISSSVSSDDCLKDGETTNQNLEEAYRNVLEHEGEKALLETKVQETFECDISSYGQYQLGKDFLLGDKVTIVNKYNIKAQGVIVEIIDTYNETGRTIIPTFSDFEVI